MKPLWEKEVLKKNHKKIADTANYLSLDKLTNDILKGKPHVPEN